MTPLPLVLAFLAGFATPQEAEKVAFDAIRKTRAQGSYTTRFNATITMPQGDPYVINGESVWVNPGILYIRYTGSGNVEKRIIRVGDQVWIYHEFLEDWVTAEEMGNGGAGRGVQNPDDILGVLVTHLKTAELGETKNDATPITVPLGGKDIAAIMKEQANQGDFDWDKSRASILLTIRNGRVEGFQSAAALVATDPNIRGQVVTYSANVTVVAFNQEKKLSFELIDESTKKKRPIPLPPYIDKAILALRSDK